MWNFSHLGTMLGSPFGGLTASVQIFALPAGQGWTVDIADFGFGLTTRLTLGTSQMPTFLAQTAHATSTTPVVVTGYAGQLLKTVIQAARLPDADGSISAYLSPLADYDSKVEVVAVNLGGESLVFAATRVTAGLSVYRAQPNGTLILLSDVGDTASAYADGISAMATVTVGSQHFLYVGSEIEHGVTGYSVAAGGVLNPINSLGVGQLIPVQNVSGLSAVVMGATSFLVTAASGSSSLTVFSVAPDGSLKVVDHIVDDLMTRFQSVTVLETIVVNGRAIIAVAGADQGITFLTLLPDGSLLHMQSLADSASYALSAISAIELVQVGSAVQVIVTSATEPGISVFELGLQNLGVTAVGAGTAAAPTPLDDLLVAAPGNTTVSGGAGNDILTDGPGQNTLIGGGGRDTFVLTFDGQSDLISDFQAGLDQIDLSLLPYLRNLQQLTIAPIVGGAVITYLGEHLTILTASGQSLTAADFSIFNLVRLTRFPVFEGVSELDWTVEDPGQPPPPPPPAGYALQQGSQFADIVAGTSQNEQFRGFAGDDEMIGGGGTDQFYGGSGFDTVSYVGETAMIQVDLATQALNSGAAAGAIFDAVEGIVGTDFNDLIYADDGSNLIGGGAGHDFLDGRGGSDTIEGGIGSDSILGRGGDDLLFGEDGDDNIAASEGDDTVYGGAGNDQIGGGNGQDLLYGGDGNDILGSGNGNDVIMAEAGNDNASGGWGHDTVDGGSGDDTLAGSFDNDLVSGGSGNDNLGGGDGNDTIHGGSGNDSIGAGAGDDLVTGGDGDDFIGGSDGDDQLWGDLGNDTLNGGVGDDIMYGGGGADTFVFNQFNAGETDTIHGFEMGFDRIRMVGVSGATQAEKFSALSITTVGLGASAEIHISHDGHLIVLSQPGAEILQADSFLFL